MYKYVLSHEATYDVPELDGVEFESEWATISGGRMTVREGYAHDGCSPKFKFLGKVWGVWDGPNDECEIASRVHDVLCQYRGLVPVTRKQTIKVFCRLLKDAGWKLRVLYVCCVYKFGPKNWTVVAR